MSSLQVRNVPDDVLRSLKTRATAEGQSLSEYVLAELTTVARRPTIDELSERIRARGSVEPSISAADVLAETRKTDAA